MDFGLDVDVMSCLGRDPKVSVLIVLGAVLDVQSFSGEYETSMWSRLQMEAESAL